MKVPRIARNLLLIFALVLYIVQPLIPPFVIQARASALAVPVFDETSFLARRDKVLHYAACEQEPEFFSDTFGRLGENSVFRLIAKAAFVQSSQECGVVNFLPASCATPGVAPSEAGCKRWKGWLDQCGVDAAHPDQTSCARWNEWLANCPVLTRNCLTAQVNLVLADAKETWQLGTDGISCPPKSDSDGDYDVVQRGLLWLLYRFPPTSAANQFGLSPAVYRHVRDDLIIVSGAPPFPPLTESYRYHPLDCGNREHETGSPANRAAAFEQLQAACAALGIPCQQSWPPNADVPPADDNESCTSSVSNFVGCLAAVIFYYVLYSAFPPAAIIYGIEHFSDNPLILLGALAGPVVAPEAAPFINGAIGVAQWANDHILIPETENHILLIETSRFLSNNLMRRDYECLQPGLEGVVCARDQYAGYTEAFDNSSNHSAEWLLRYLRTFFRRDFIEYNSRPYSRYSFFAIQNLYDLACATENPCTGDNLRVKIAARNVLDFLTAKAAVSNDDFLRLVPFRRQAERLGYHPPEHADFMDLFSGTGDFQAFHLLMLFGQQQVPPCSTQSANDLCPSLLDAGWIELLATGISSYRAPSVISALMPGARTDPTLQIPEGYLQRFTHGATDDGAEVYFGSPNFLISGGGIGAEPAYLIEGHGGDNDRGVIVPTSLIPTGVLKDNPPVNNSMTHWDQFLRFDGASNAVNLCVERNFACGLNFQIPQRYMDCTQTEGKWGFVNAPRCPDESRGNFYVAYYRDACSVSSCSGAQTFGLMEVIESSRMDFDAFKASVLATNGQKVFSPDGPDVYSRIDGEAVVVTGPSNIAHIEFRRDITFSPTNASIAGWEDLSTWPLAGGDIINADGKGCVILNVANRAGSTLHVMSLADYTNPFNFVVTSGETELPREANCDQIIPYMESTLK